MKLGKSLLIFRKHYPTPIILADEQCRIKMFMKLSASLHFNKVPLHTSISALLSNSGLPSIGVLRKISKFLPQTKLYVAITRVVEVVQLSRRPLCHDQLGQEL